MSWPPVDSESARELREDPPAAPQPRPRRRNGPLRLPPVEPVRRPWCGRCDKRTRLLELDDVVVRCRSCHPLTASTERVSS